MIQAESGWRAWIMAGEFWLSEAQWGAIGPLLPKNQVGREGPTTGGHQRRRPRSEDRLSLAALPGGLRAFDDGLQSLSPLDDARDLASLV
jgi:hypothetical protein